MTAPRVFEGNLDGTGLKMAVVVARFNTFISEKLLAGALDALTRHNVAAADIDVAWVPGSFDIPLVAKRLAQSGRYDAICAVGAVIRGGTPHFEYVAGQMARGLAEASWQTDVPVAFGVLTTDTLEQAIERAGTKGGNKGFDCAMAAIEMARLLRALPKK